MNRAGAREACPAQQRVRVSFIALNYSPEITGNAAYTTDLAERLASRGLSVQVVTGAPHYPGWRTWSSMTWKRCEVANGAQVARFRSYVPRNPGFAKRSLYETLYGLRLGIAAPKSVDVVILPSPGLFTSGVALTVLRLRGWKGRSVLWMQDRYAMALAEKKSKLAHLASRGMSLMEAMVARSVDRVVVIHERWKPEVSSDLGLKPQNVVPIRNWTHVKPPVDCNRGEIRHHLGWRDGEIIAVHAGNMGVKQGLENLVDAARLADRRNLPVRFVLIGDGSQRVHLEACASGVERIQFLPHLGGQQYSAALCAADALILNERPGQRSSAVPSKLTSYFSTGVPIVAATENDGVAAAEVRASGAGVVVAPGRPEEILELLAPEALRAAAAVALTSGPAYVRAKLSVESAIDEFERLIRDLVCEDGVGGRERSYERHAGHQ